MQIEIPEYCLVMLIGASGSGKSTFAHKHFAPTEVISSDYCRALVSDDATDQAATRDAFEVLEFIARKRLAARRLTVIDATNVRAEDRSQFVRLAREYHAFPVSIIFDLPERICQERNAKRQDRNFGPHVVHNHIRLLRRSIKQLGRKGSRYRFRLRSEAEIDSATINRQPLWTDRRDDTGPFDIIGDIHGCFEELSTLLDKLGYKVECDGDRFEVSHPQSRRLIFLGDIIDRGPGIVNCLRLVMDAVECGVALCIPGNHEVKLLRKLRGRNVTLTHGLDETVAQMEAESPVFHDRVAAFIDSLVSHYMFDAGKLVVAHAGLKAEMQNRSSGAVREFALYGETTGETDEFGFPVRYNWAGEYRGDAAVVYGHTPVPRAEWVNHTICVDTGCVFGGSLTALRYPERELVSVPAGKIYYAPTGPGLTAAPELSAQHTHDEVLDIDDVLGKHIVDTRYLSNITVRQENAAAALEVMSRFAINPKWLIYLPPTMSPCGTSDLEGLLEHPAEAFGYFRGNGVQKVICEEKHMGSRALVVVCRDEDAARNRFGVNNESAGVIYTRTGRGFFNDDSFHGGFEKQILDRIRSAADQRGFWKKFDTDWFCLDCEIMPWSAKAGELLQTHYQPVADAARIGLAQAVAALESATVRGLDSADLLQRFQTRSVLADNYNDAFKRYNWPVSTVDDLKLAPFHLLATEGEVHTNKDHGWHMEQLADLCADDDLLMTTACRTVDLDDEAGSADAILWWETLTAAGGEGMVVKPWNFVVRKGQGMVQPAVKCRGREYLRIIYGPDYTMEENLARLRQRGLGAKRSLARREFALGLEGLERFIQREPLRRVHECVFAVLALESEPVDPRL